MSLFNIIHQNNQYVTAYGEVPLPVNIATSKLRETINFSQYLIDIDWSFDQNWRIIGETEEETKKVIDEYHFKMDVNKYNI